MINIEQVDDHQILFFSRSSSSRISDTDFGDYAHWHSHIHTLVADGLFLESEILYGISD